MARDEVLVIGRISKKPSTACQSPGNWQCMSISLQVSLGIPSGYGKSLLSLEKKRLQCSSFDRLTLGQAPIISRAVI
jgi:hypothetical protein